MIESPRPAASDQAPAQARTARRAALALTLGAVAIATGFGMFAWRLAPPEGDLMRVSGGSSRLYGWQGAAEGFAREHRRPVSLTQLLAGEDPGEALVFGDSFSNVFPGGVSWINTLHARTGLEIATARLDGFDEVLRYLRSEAFAERPPRAVIVQTVERGLLRRAAGVAESGASCPALVGDGYEDYSGVAAPGAGAPLDPPRRVFRRRTAFMDFDELMSWGALAARLRLTGPTEPVLMLPLTRGDLFTHRAAGQVPVLGADVDAHLPPRMRPADPRAAAEAVRCGLRRLARAAQAGGGTAFRVLIAPDKRSAYAPWIAAELPEKRLDLFAAAREALGPMLVDPLPRLRAEIAAGRRDLYLPDDSHWGPEGHRLAGALAAQALIGEDP